MENRLKVAVIAGTPAASLSQLTLLGTCVADSTGNVLSLSHEVIAGDATQKSGDLIKDLGTIFANGEGMSTGLSE